MDDWDDDENFNLYTKQVWIGLSSEEVEAKMQELFDDTVTYEFVDEFRETEEMLYNYVAFKLKDDVVVESRWG